MTARPYTILRATQLFEFLAQIADSAVVDGVVRLPSAQLQPIAVADLAVAVADLVEGEPANAVVEVAGPEAVPLDELVRRALGATGDARDVVRDEDATYVGAHIGDRSLTPGPAPGSARRAWTTGSRRRARSGRTG